MSESSLGDWISKVETKGDERHAEMIQRVSVLETNAKESKEREKSQDEKLTQILEILSQSRGIVSLLKVGGYVLAAGASLAMIYEAIVKKAH
jgi:hypothetical protein